MLNLKTNHISFTRNVAFLQRSYGDHMSKNTEVDVKENQESMLIMTGDKDDDKPQLLTDANIVSNSESESDDELASENISVINNSTSNDIFEVSDYEK